MASATLTGLYSMPEERLLESFSRLHKHLHITHRDRRECRNLYGTGR